MEKIEIIKDFLGIILILLGAAFQVLLLWKELRPSPQFELLRNFGDDETKSVPDITKIMLAILEKLPWLSVAGFILFYAGIQLIQL